MKACDRRKFLSLASRSATAFASLPLLPLDLFPTAAETTPVGQPLSYKDQPATERACWLDLCAPFIVEDAARGLHSEVVLTSDTFVGARGYADGRDATEYEFYLYDADGRAVGAAGAAARLKVSAMQTAVIPVRDLIAPHKSFWGGLTIRLRPVGRQPMHATDLFSSAFVRWQTDGSFDNVHANPDPVPWQTQSSFYYSMPFPPLSDYECTVGLFNPYEARSAGRLVMRDGAGGKLIEIPYELKPRASLLLALNEARFTGDACAAFGLSAPGSKASSNAARAGQVMRTHHEAVAGSLSSVGSPLTRGGGMLTITNDQGTAKSFAYLVIKKTGRDRFSVEHPLHQPVSKPLPSVAPFTAEGKFKAKNILFSPLLFRAKRVGAITLESRFHLSTGLPYEEALWFAPYAVGPDGSVAWNANDDAGLPPQLPAAQWERGAIRLGSEQSCVLDFSRLKLGAGFSGGLCLAVAPDSTHTFMKVEVRVPEWGAHAFTHFRPGLRAARAYQKPAQRGGLATDYVTSGASFERRGDRVFFDELIGVINIDDQGIEASPVLELFGRQGLVRQIALPPVPGFACRHFLLSDLLKEPLTVGRMSMRLIDERATLLMSTVHIDYARRDIALDHGSDRFSTFTDYHCGTRG
ncbi:MAG: hypothetical protein LC785_10935 [Acidobacteria bacterium]|nr:hypothetical protein [Acidobacteriota bacterium]MCA1642441.1 hypothetical protein [Acidobacteriota bacterium]